MKKIVYLLMVLGLIFTTACDPMDDIHAEIDAIENPVVGEANYTLSDEDYDELGLSFGSFSSVDDAKAMIPGLLTNLYPVYGKGSSVLAGYDLYIGNAFTVRDYSLTQADYTLSGSNVLGFQFDATPEDYLADIISENYSSLKEGDYVAATYFQYTGSAYTVTPTVSLEENFDYGTVAGDLTTVSSGVWEAHSGAGNGPIGYATSSLSMTDYPSTGIAGSLTIDGGASEDVSDYFPEIPSGTVYASALVNLSAVSTGTYTFHLRDSDFTVGYVARVGAMDDGSGKILFGIGASSSSLTYGTTAFDLDTTYLLVSTYDIATGLSNLYVLSTAEGTEPASPEATSSGTPGAIISGVSIRQGFGGPTGTIDGIRVANTWSSIMSNEVLDDEVVGNKESYKSVYTYTDEGTWEVPSSNFYALSDTDFESMGLTNFGSSTSPDNYLPTFLGIKYPYAQEGDELDITYNYVSSSSGAQTRGNLYTFTDGVWVGYQSTISTTLQFGHDGTTWVPDNTIRYTLNADDYSYIVSTYAAAYPSETSNMASYGNFNGFSWTDDMILEVVGGLLLHRNPSAAEGQKYIATYSIYDGSTHDESINVILEDGVYVLN